MINILLYLCENFVVKEINHSLRSYGMEILIHGNAYTLLALTHAEGAAELYLLTKLVLSDEILKLFYYLTRTL